jgi:hypothetical protein
MRMVVMRKFGVILFGLALGLSVVRPAPAAAYTWDMICSGNQLNLCASVSVAQSGTTVIMTVKNLSNSILTAAGWAGSGFFGYFTSAPNGWTTTAVSSMSYSDLRAASNGNGSGIRYNESVAFHFKFMGDFKAGALALFLDGEDLTSGGEVDPGNGGDDFGTYAEAPPTNGAPMESTTVPEPGTLLLLGTGLAGMAVIRRRRRNEDME